MADHWFETAFGAHYPLLYRHRDVAEAKQCLALLDALVPLGEPDRERILDLGCGDGRHLDLLLGQGREAVGLDLSAELLAFARGRNGWDRPPGLVRGDMRRLPFLPGCFTSVLSLFTAFGYFGSSDANRDPVREIARVLAPGGHWYLDYLDGDQVRGELGSGETSVRERELEPLAVREERWFDEKESLVCKRVFLKPLAGRRTAAGEFGIPPAGIDYTEQVTVFTLDQLLGMATDHGLERVADAGGYAGEPLGRGNRWILVFRKKTKALKI